LLSALPRARTKCPSGYREVLSHLSMVTRIFWPIKVGAWRVRRRIRGRRRETGVAKTVCWDKEVVLDDVKDVLSMWQTYLIDLDKSENVEKNSVKKIQNAHALQFRFMTPTIRPVGCRSFARFAAFSARRTLDSRTTASLSSISSSEFSASSFLSVAAFGS
jgi:hypothetical protein